MAKSRSLLPKPENLDPQDWDLIKWSAKNREDALKSTDPEICQAYIRASDKQLKLVAELQTKLGEDRSLIGRHCQNLRQAMPKGKPSEGTVKVLPSGTQVIFLDGQWAPYGGPPVVKEENK